MRVFKSMDTFITKKCHKICKIIFIIIIIIKLISSSIYLMYVTHGTFFLSISHKCIVIFIYIFFNHLEMI
jgi:hypothetical protein